jgi:hypothetical protein
LPVLVKQTAEQVASAHGASVILARNGQPGERVWRTMHECPVRTVAVAMLAVDPKDLLQVATADDQQQSRHSARTVRTQRSAYAFAFGACTGVKSTSAPSERNTSSKLRGTDSPGGQSWAARARWAGHRGPDCRHRAPERHEERIPLSADLDAACLGNGSAHERRMLVPDRHIPVARLLQQPSGALDVGEQEGDRPGRQLRHVSRMRPRTTPIKDPAERIAGRHLRR